MSSLKQKLNTIAKPLGYALIALSSIAWLAVFAIPFLDYDLFAIAGIITALIIFAEICFYIAILLLGKPLWEKLKASLLSKLQDKNPAGKE